MPLITGTYDYRLVALSVALAMVTSYAALDLAGRVTASSGWARFVWLNAGAVAMGFGIWAMHYVGMLAFQLPVPVLYHYPTVALSLLAAIAASAVALFVVSRPRMGLANEVVGSILMAAGIAGMHYIGMAAMRLPATMELQADRVILSIVLAILVSLVALTFAFGVRLERKTSSRKIGSAILMGCAIPLMHYTGMWAADFHPGNPAINLAHTISVPEVGATVIAMGSFALLGLAIASSFLDRLLASRTSDLTFIRERELYLQTMAETIPEIIWTADAQGSTDFTNRKWLDYSGLAPEQSKGSGWTVAVHPEDLKACWSKWEDARHKGEHYEDEFRLRGKDNVFRWFLVRANPVRDAGGTIIKWFGTCTDIENQKHSQKVLREQIVESTRQLADVNTRLQEEQYFRKLTDGIPEIIWTADPQGMVDYVNRKTDYIGRTTEQLYGAAWADAIHPDDQPLVLKKWQAALSSGQPYEVEYRLHGNDSSFRWFLVRANPIRSDGGEIEKWIGTCTDIENQKQSQQILEHQILDRTMQLADANERLQQEMAEKDDARKQLDDEHEKSMRDLEQRSERAAMLAKMGELLQSCISRDEVIAVALSFAPKIFPTGRGAVFLLNDARTLAELAGSWSECQLPEMDFETSECWALRTGHLHLVYAEDTNARCRHAAELQCSHLCVPILAQGETLGILHLQAKESATRLDPAELSFRMTFAGQVGLSITNIKLRDALRTQSIRDALTGLYNRRYLEEILEREFRRSSRSQQHLGIIMIDLDHFKSFNDAFGHDAGDAVLRETGLLLTKCIRVEDFVCRYGGEEFVVILPTANLQAAQARAENLRTRMRQLTILHQGKPMGMITISAGVAGFPDHGATPQEVIAAADAALYDAKRNGRDQVVVASTPAREGMELSASANSAPSCQS